MDKNYFILNNIYPDADEILKQKPKSPDDIFLEAIFVLDTNALLAPFQTGKDGMDKIKGVYSNLIAEDRLFVPKHVIREFAKNRSTKISELYSTIDRHLSSVSPLNLLGFPVLEGISAYKDLKTSRDKIHEEQNNYKQALKDLKDGITAWNWSDPITEIYSEIFTSNCLIESTLSEEDLQKNYEYRILNDIPPGNKDKSKDKNAIGDYIIWQTIIELGQKLKKDIVFVSNDEKNDWLLKGNKQSISTKFELVEEFWRETQGNSFLSITFSNFLELRGVEIQFRGVFESLFDDSGEEQKKRTKSVLESLETIHGEFTLFHDFSDSEYPYFSEIIYKDINHFIDNYIDEFGNSPLWSKYGSYFSLFDDWLEKIKSYNQEIVYQEHRMKRDTETEKVLMDALVQSFILKYGEFLKVIHPHG